MSNESNHLIEEIIQKTTPILKSGGVVRSFLFGSIARGDARVDSDIDILVEMSHGKRLFDLVELKENLEEVLKKNVDIVTTQSVHPLLLPYIEKDKVLFF